MQGLDVGKLKKKMEETPAEMLELAIPEIRLRFGSDAKMLLLSHDVELDLAGVQFQVPQRGDKAAVVAPIPTQCPSPAFGTPEEHANC